MSLAPQTTARGYQLKFETQPRSKLWVLGSAFTSIACAVSFYFGHQIATPLMAASWSFVSISSFTGPRITTRHLIMILNGYLVSEGVWLK